MKQTIGIILGSLIISGAIFYASYSWQMLKVRELNDLARFQCAQSSNYQTTDPSGALVSYPVSQMYTTCLTEKGMDK